jgi:hypothetical protein
MDYNHAVEELYLGVVHVAAFRYMISIDCQANLRASHFWFFCFLYSQSFVRFICVPLGIEKGRTVR